VGGQAEANETCLWHFACGNDVTTRGLNDDSGGWGGSSARQRHPVGIASAEWQSARGCVGSQRDRGLAALQRGASTRGTTAQTLIQQPKEGVATEVAVAVTLAAGCEVRAKVSAIGE